MWTDGRLSYWAVLATLILSALHALWWGSPCFTAPYMFIHLGVRKSSPRNIWLWALLVKTDCNWTSYDKQVEKRQKQVVLLLGWIVSARLLSFTNVLLRSCQNTRSRTQAKNPLFNIWYWCFRSVNTGVMDFAFTPQTNQFWCVWTSWSGRPLSGCSTPEFNSFPTSLNKANQTSKSTRLCLN